MGIQHDERLSCWELPEGEVGHECGMVEVLNILGARASVSELVWYFHVAL
jgi:hypothetical protein